MGFVHLLWRFPKAPWHHVGSFPGLALRPQDGPDSFHACRFDGRKWWVSVTPSPVQTSCVSRSWPSTNSGIGSSWERSINSGNHDAAGCSWVIKITFTPGDWAIFCSTWGTILNGGYAYRRPLPLSQGMDMASVHSALGSGYGDTNLTSRLLANVANKSIHGSPHLANTGRRLSMAIVHSVVSVWPTLCWTASRWTGSLDLVWDRTSRSWWSRHTECILDSNVRSLYRRTFNNEMTSISDRLYHYRHKSNYFPTTKMKSLCLPGCVSRSDSYMSQWIIYKVDPNYDAYRRQKSSIKSCIGHRYVMFMKYDARLSLWRVDTNVFCPILRRPRLRWNAMESPGRVHSSQPKTRPVSEHTDRTYMHETSSGCVTDYPVWCDVGVCRIKNGADVNKDTLTQYWKSNKIKANGRCFSLVPVIDECWHIKFRHVKHIL